MPHLAGVIVLPYEGHLDSYLWTYYIVLHLTGESYHYGIDTTLLSWHSKGHRWAFPRKLVYVFVICVQKGLTAGMGGLRKPVSAATFS